MKLKALFLIFSSSVISKPAMISSHVKCRGGVYPRSDVQRFEVPDDKVSWSSNFKDYKPPKDPTFRPKWNSIDGNVSRNSYTGDYLIVDGVPLNPVGRTGITGRGVLGRWGPNHAADSVVTRWKILPTGLKEYCNGKAVLQFVAIERRDSGELALPGGMVDPGEKVAAAAFREFQEEAINSLKMTPAAKEAWQAKFKKFFTGGDIIYRGYVDDPRNTDNAWIETIAYSFHDESAETVGGINLKAGDDAKGVRWLDIDSELKLYASHKEIVKAAAEKLDAHWYAD